MFTIDAENCITHDGKGDPFSSLKELTGIASSRNWSKQDVTEIWNGFAGTAGFDECKPLKCFRNRPYGIQRIWEAVQRLKPTEDTASSPAAPTEAKSEKTPKGPLATLIKLMRRKSGVSVDEAMAATGWGATHTVRGRISILKSQGMVIERSKHATRGTVYHAS